MSSGKSLGIIALIIGISGLGLGIYSVIFPVIQVRDDSKLGIQETWFKYDPTIYYTSPFLTNITIDNISISFSVKLGESVYFLFVTEAILSSAATATIFINLVLDGVILYSPEYPEAMVYSSNQVHVGSLSLQISINTITPGTHNATINILGPDVNSYIQESTLLIHTYIP